MSEKIQIATFENGELRVFGEGERENEAVLGLPLNRLLAKVVTVPAERAEESAAVVAAELKAVSPYPDEELTAGYENIRTNADGSRLVLAAALPESAAEDIAAALDEKKLNVTRIDALAFGEIRAIWSKVGQSEKRRMVVMKSVDCLSLLVLDGDAPVAVRAISPAANLKREAFLSMLEAERTAGAAEISEIVLVGFGPDEGGELARFAALRRLDRAGDENQNALDGLAARNADGQSLDATPASWREVLEETRFKAKLRKFVTCSAVVWALAMAVLFGVPFGYGYLTDRQKAASREHRRQYEAVKTVKGKVAVVKKYSDHSRGALETLRAVNECLPPLPADEKEISVELVSWNFKRAEGVRFAGEAADPQLVYDFKNRLADSGAFATVNLNGPQSAKGGRHRFEIECLFEAGEAE